MTFHSELQIVWLIFEGGVSSIVNSMHDVMRRGEGGHNVTARVHDDVIFLLRREHVAAQGRRSRGGRGAIAPPKYRMGGPCPPNPKMATAT